MTDIDRIIEQLLGSERMRESATFSSRTYSDQPLIERGRDMQARIARREAERAARRERDARERAARRAASSSATPTTATREVSTQQDIPPRQVTRQPGLSDRLFSFAHEAATTLANGNLLNHREQRLPAPIREMRRLERGGVPSSLAYGSAASASLFYRQAKLMEDYEDDYEFHGSFSQYYPTYAAMSDHQLRGYFSWRTRVRAGEVRPAPLSFAFVYVYELLCGIGTTPGSQGLSDLRSFAHDWNEAAEIEGQRLESYLGRWMRDYAIYHNIADELPRASAADADALGTGAITLLRAEHAQLRAQGAVPRVDNTATQGITPTRDELFAALNATSTYRIGESRLAKADHDLVADVTGDVFAALVTHCARRRKTDFVEGLFGYAYAEPYTMFSAAVFFEEEPHPDASVQISDLERYVCQNGRWRRLMACEARHRSSELGAILHEIDYQLREKTSYAYPLKHKDVPKYVARIIATAADARLAERAEAERRRIRIDLSQLASIRAAAAQTQEALLTDEERGEEQVTPPVPTVPLEATPAAMPSAAAEPEVSFAATDVTADVAVPTTSSNDAGPATSPSVSSDSPLSPTEHRLLSGLLAGEPASTLLGPGDPFVSVVADSINEKLFDLVGDAIIEFDGDEPCIIEDYLDDVREVLQS